MAFLSGFDDASPVGVGIEKKSIRAPEVLNEPIEYEKSFSVEQFKANLQFAINVDFKQAYLWGVEWWYVQKNKGNTQYWDLAKSIFKNDQ